MSFRLFVYYCAICGGWAAFFGWMLGFWFLAPNPTHQPAGVTVAAADRHDPSQSTIKRTGLRGLALGVAVALGLSLLDSFWVIGLKRVPSVAMRVGMAILIGAIGGLLGGVVGQSLYEWKTFSFFLIAGWTLTGTLIGISIAAFDIMLSVFTKQNLVHSRRKLIKCLLGGTVGGMVGGVLFELIRSMFALLFSGKELHLLWTPSAVGFVVLGASIGLLVGLAQIILKEAWVRVEAGFRPGREMILAKESTSIGRAESADIALFGDPGVEKAHAFIVQKNGQYILQDNDTPGGTYVNDVKVNKSIPLHSGDLIRMGAKSLVRFYERPKKENR